MRLFFSAPMYPAPLFRMLSYYIFYLCGTVLQGVEHILSFVAGIMEFDLCKKLNVICVIFMQMDKNRYYRGVVFFCQAVRGRGRMRGVTKEIDKFPLDFGALINEHADTLTLFECF